MCCHFLAKRAASRDWLIVARCLLADPHEKEILFAPLGGLEIQQLSVEGTVLVPDIRLSINLNAATIDQVIGRRRKLLKDMGDNMAVEVSAALSGSGFEAASVRMLDEMLSAEALAKPVVWYNQP